MSLYEKNPCLYDTSLKVCDDKNLKRTAKADIAEKLQKTGQFTNYVR